VQTFRSAPYVNFLMRIKIVGSVTFTEFGTNNADPYGGSDFKNKLGRRLGHCTILRVKTCMRLRNTNIPDILFPIGQECKSVSM
jgi:hypothetical protein